MLNFNNYIPNHSQYITEYFPNLYYRNNIYSFPPTSQPYTINRIKTESHSERNDFFIGHNKTINSYIKNVSTLLTSIDNNAQPLDKKMIALRLRYFLFPSFNIQPSHSLFSHVIYPEYTQLPHTNLAQSIINRSTNYLHELIFIMTCLRNNTCTKASSYSECISKLNQQLPEVLQCFQQPSENETSYSFADDCPNLYYKSDDSEKIKFMCQFLITHVFPECLDQCKKWFIIDANSFSVPNNYELYIAIAHDILNVLFTFDISITGYKAAISFAEQLLNDIKTKLSLHTPAHMLLQENNLIPGYSDDIDGLYYQYIQAINSDHIDSLRFSIHEIFVKYLCYLHRNEQKFFSRYYKKFYA